MLRGRRRLDIISYTASPFLHSRRRSSTRSARFPKRAIAFDVAPSAMNGPSRPEGLDVPGLRSLLHRNESGDGSLELLMPERNALGSTSISGTTDSTSGALWKSPPRCLSWDSPRPDRQVARGRPDTAGQSDEDPNSVIALIWPATLAPFLWLIANSSHGFGMPCFMPSEIRRRSSVDLANHHFDFVAELHDFGRYRRKCSLLVQSIRTRGRALRFRLRSRRTRPVIGDVRHLRQRFDGGYARQADPTVLSPLLHPRNAVLSDRT